LVLTAGLEDYLIPGIGEIPEIDIHSMEDGFEHVPGVGLGELSTIAVSASIGNAIHKATGWRAHELRAPDPPRPAARRGLDMSATSRSFQDLRAARGEYRAGGTDLQQRLRSGASRGLVVDLIGLPGLDQIDWDERGRARIGALVPMATLASDPQLCAHKPAASKADVMPALARMLPSRPEQASAGGRLRRPLVARSGSPGPDRAADPRAWTGSGRRSTLSVVVCDTAVIDRSNISSGERDCVSAGTRSGNGHRGC
jgi:hypothetical protein